MYTKHSKEQVFAEFVMESSCLLSHDCYVTLGFVCARFHLRRRRVWKANKHVCVLCYSGISKRRYSGIVQMQQNAAQLYNECQQNVATRNIMFSSFASSGR
jgi:hypothetical protein